MSIVIHHDTHKQLLMYQSFFQIIVYAYTLETAL